MRNVLFIAYYYPPIGGAGIVRSLYFSKYLPAFGWTPHVLTVANPDRFYAKTGNDAAPEDISVYRAHNILNNLSVFEGGLRRLGIHAQVLVPDAFIGWIPGTIRKGHSIINKKGIDAIYVSCPPFSAALAALQLKKRAGLPLIVDLRDAWTLNTYSSHYACGLLRRYDKKLERMVLESANTIITATDGIRQDYIREYPGLVDKTFTIFNGFDFSTVPTNQKPFEKFTITYTGFFYGSRRPDLLFAALRQIAMRCLIPRDRIQFVWAGPEAPWIRRLAREYEIEEYVQYLGMIPKADADELLSRSHLLYFVVGPAGHSGPNSTLTGKIFSYIASNRPILAQIPEGAAKELVMRYSDNSYVIPMDGESDMITAIVDAYSRWQRGTLISNSSEKDELFRATYNYSSLAHELADAFNRSIYKNGSD